MVKTITNIDGSKVLAALKAAKPVTATGKVAVENLRKFVGQNRLTATAVEQALTAFESLRADVGITSVIGTLKGLMPAMNRAVAITYETIANEDKSLFLAASTEAEHAVAELYKYNSDKIIDKLVNGDLDAFATNPAIAQLIKYAKAARADQARIDPVITLPNDNFKVTLVPVLNIAMLNDSILASIDGNMYIVGPQGQLSQASDLSDANLDSTVGKLLTLLAYLQPSAEPNVLTLKPAYAEAAAKHLSISKFELDLLADNNSFVGINGNFMSLEKAQAILAANRPEVLAATLLSADAREALNVIVEIMTVMYDYRGALLTNLYAKKFSASTDQGDIAIYVVKSGVYFNVIATNNSSVLSVKAYNDIMEVLADAFVSTNVPLHNAIQASYAADIDAATSKMNVRVKLANDLANDIAKLQSLYDSIVNEIDSLGSMSDANPDKQKALQELKKKTEDQLESAKAELDKLN